MKEFKIRITDIEYMVSEAEAMEYAEYHGMLPLDEDILMQAEEAILEELPASIETTVRCESEEDIYDMCGDIVRDATGYFFETCSYEILEKKEVK